MGEQNAVIIGKLMKILHKETFLRCLPCSIRILLGTFQVMVRS